MDCFASLAIRSEVISQLGRSAVKQPCVYMVANKRDRTIHTGVASDLPWRAYEHREGVVKGFTAKYGCKMLVWLDREA